MKTPTLTNPPSPQTEALVRQLSKKRIEEDLRQYLKLLDSKVREGKIHEFLASHSYFFNGILDLYSHSPLYSKIKLGHDYEVDFAWLNHDSFGAEWRLVEIEGARSMLFTKSGNPSAILTHAIQQIRDWLGWIHDHAEYVRKLMPKIDYPWCYLFLGRRCEITPTNQKKLKRLRYDYSMQVEIHTLDWFARAAANTAHLVGIDGGDWRVPMNALSHRELKKGVPPAAQKWLEVNYSDWLLQQRKGQRKSVAIINSELDLT